MTPKETDNLLATNGHDESKLADATFYLTSQDTFSDPSTSKLESGRRCRPNSLAWTGIVLLATFAFVGTFLILRPRSFSTSTSAASRMARIGPYLLSERHVGAYFLDFYTFYEGEDSMGSAGYNIYTPHDRAMTLNLVNVTRETDRIGDNKEQDFVYLSSLPTELGKRESVRLEGKTRFNDGGLFILDVDHIPAGCGQWPAFWLTDEDAWPNHGEIDIVEGINYQPVAKTALHTSSECSMYGHVADYDFSGHWDRATGLPDTFTGQMDFETSVPADNCWVMAPHQWANQGCVAVSDANNTLGPGLNQAGGAVFALQWDPYIKHAIRSWTFPKELGIPSNLQEIIGSKGNSSLVAPEPDSWGLPYAAFSVGEGTGCSADHFKNMRIVLNTAFCGTVADNRFFRDCPVQSKKFNISNDPVLSCNAWIHSQPDELIEAFWKIRGVYVYERQWEHVNAKQDGN